MSLVITAYVREGIAMAADSRLTLNTTRQDGPNTHVHVAVGQTDSTYKLFLAPGDIGIGTYGTADIGGVPIGGFIESFIREKMPKPQPVEDVPNLLLEYFRGHKPVPQTFFHVAGYSAKGGHLEQQLWQVDVAADKATRANQRCEPGVSWGGESDVLVRLIQPVGLMLSPGQQCSPLPQYQIPWGFFTMQDAIDYCVYAVRTTIDAMRFQPRPKTVGGPIDVLVIKPDRAYWVQRKELRVIVPS